MPTTQSSKLCVQLNRLLSLYSGIGNQFKGLGAQRILGKALQGEIQESTPVLVEKHIGPVRTNLLILLKRAVR